MSRLVDAMDGQQLQTIATQTIEGEGKQILELFGIVARWNLALQNAVRIWTVRQGPAELPFRTAVMTGGFHMVKPVMDGPLKRAQQVGLGLIADLFSRQITPALLKPHASEGEHGHRQLGSPETPCGQWGGHEA